jgi:phage gpG-like protein
MWIKLTVDSREAQGLLDGIESRGRDLTPYMRAFGEYMKGSIDKNFAAGGRPEPWAPLKLGTTTAWALGRKTWWKKSGALSAAGAKALGRRTPLTDTGALRRSIRHVAGSRSVEIYASKSQGGVNIAAVHQFGATLPPLVPKSKLALFWPGAAHPVKRTKGGRIPARPFLLFQAEDLQEFRDGLASYLLRGR